MDSTSARSAAAGSLSRWWIHVIVVVGAILGGLAYRMRHDRVRPPVPAAEVHRNDLELRDGRWFSPGLTNGFTGWLLDTYVDGTLKSRSAVSNGLLEGLSEGWFTNRQRQVEEHFHAGVSHGPRLKWHPNGQRSAEATIVAGRLEGTFRRWHTNGVLAEAISMSNGVPHGVARAWSPEGLLMAETTMEQGIPMARSSGAMAHRQ